MTVIQRVDDPGAWDAALLRWPRPHVLQSWLWGECKAQTGWRAHRLLVVQEGKPVAAASMLVRSLGRLPVRIAYVPKGPTLDWDDPAAAMAALTAIEQEARRQRVLFVKIDPDVVADAPIGATVQDLLRSRGWRPSAEQIQFRNPMLVDLRPGEAELLAAMKPKWRYNIRLAARRGVVVRAGTAGDLATFYALYAETSARDGFLIRPFSYYRLIWERFLAAGQGYLLLAEVEGEPVAGLFLFRFGPTAWYFYGASSERERRRMPNHLLQWEAMRWARTQGCAVYDLWGAPDVLNESDPMWGVYRFKQGFGGRFTSWIGAWDFPVSRVGYWLYMVAMPRVLELMRRRHRRSSV
ncbi:MAG: peptidoglycan bridge formation glycyltransferase FemA/FemB family protein [Anaerolineae bacterium]|nr:peptidoglycan bridge formation glycyltransferase FemA/FemB family protein [Anaerolineae bacterium]